MRRVLIAVFAVLSLTLSPLAASAEGEPLFITESEAAESHVTKHETHPVIWVFVGIGAASLGVCGWMAFVNREKKPQKEKKI